MSETGGVETKGEWRIQLASNKSTWHNFLILENYQIQWLTVEEEGDVPEAAVALDLFAGSGTLTFGICKIWERSKLTKGWKGYGSKISSSSLVDGNSLH